MSTDAKTWETTREANLLRNVSSGRYYARFAVGGKKKWIALKTTKWTVAKVRLAEKRVAVERQRQASSNVETGESNMGELMAIFGRQIESRAELSQKTRNHYGHILKVFDKTWPGFTTLTPDRISRQAVTDWRNRVHKDGTGFKPPGAKAVSAAINGSSSATINKAIDILRRMIDIAVERGQLGSNPLGGRGIKLKLTPKKPTLPDPAGLNMVFAEMERGSGIIQSQRRDAADMARFIAYTGCRRGEAEAVTWGDVDFGRGLLHVRGTKTAAANREVPLIAAARALLTSIRDRRLTVSEVRVTDNVLAIGECTKSLTRACKAVGTPRLTHHDLRDAFATTAIESGVDIPTVASWLGHADGGALLMRVYTHHRRPHSLAQAAKVTF